MPVGQTRKSLSKLRPARAGYCGGLTALILLIGCQSLQTAVANGDTRTITLHHVHTGEDLSITYKRDGRYDDDALKKIDWLLRDWRRAEAIRMDPRLIDLLWEVHREVDAKDAIQIICGYRAPETNAMLRRRSNGVAETSHHMGGNAIDYYIPGVPLEQLRNIGLRLQRGGVGYYPTSGSPFVHMDVGSVRHWPRMTHDQLARVFPDGRTVHIPSDGKPLAQYALALADVERRGSRPSAPSLAAAQHAGVNTEVATTAPAPSGNILAALFGRNDDDGDRTTATSSRKPAATRVAALAPEKAAEPTSVVRLPPSRPAMSYQVASAAPVPAPPPRPARQAAVRLAGLSANDIINERGYWQGLTEADPIAALTRATRAGGPRNDRAPAELALAYAAPSDPLPGERPNPMGQAASRAMATGSLPAASGAVAKRVPARTAAAPFAVGGPSATMALRAGERFDNPWLRAMIIAPSAHQFMSVTLLGAPNYSRLAPLMAKPASAVMMTFSADPHLGLRADRFTGEAVVFVATVTFAPRQTAALR